VHGYVVSLSPSLNDPTDNHPLFYFLLECATCHVYIEPPFNARLSDISDAEEDMLEYAVGRKVKTSRLGCQIKIQPEMEGMVVKLPQY
jgi:ferredoxin